MVQNTVSKILGVREPTKQTFSELQKQSVEAVEDFSVRKHIATKTLIADTITSTTSLTAGAITVTTDQSSVDTAYVPMILYNTDATPPTASGFPIGTLYVQYTP